MFLPQYGVFGRFICSDSYVPFSVGLWSTWNPPSSLSLIQLTLLSLCVCVGWQSPSPYLYSPFVVLAFNSSPTFGFAESFHMVRENCQEPSPLPPHCAAPPPPPFPSPRLSGADDFKNPRTVPGKSKEIDKNLVAANKFLTKIRKPKCLPRYCRKLSRQPSARMLISLTSVTRATVTFDSYFLILFLMSGKC